MAKEGITVTTRWLEPCLHGPQILHIHKDHPDFNKELNQILRAAEAEVGA
jgi:homoserine kinase